MLTKYIKPFFIVLILLVFIFLFKDINTYASSNIDLSEYYCETDTIYDLRDVSNINPLLDEDNNEIKVDEYTDKLLGSNVSGNNSGLHLEYNVSNDDPIINVVPRECFLTTGNYFCDGDAYAYYVKTTTKYASNYLDTGNIPGTCLRSDVLIIDYSSNVDEINYNFNGSYIKESLNIHQYVFYTINLNESIIFLPNIFDIIHFSVSSDYAKDNVIIPAPIFDVNEYHFSETASNLNVRSNSAYISMENEHDSNENNGRFFIGALSIYHGLKTEPIESDDKGLTDTIIEKIVGIIVDKFVNYNPIFTAMVSTLENISNIFDFVFKEYLEINIETSNESLMDALNMLETIKSKQITKYGRLIKSLIYRLEDGFKMFYNGDYVDYYFRYGCDSGEATSTTFNSAIMYDIYDDNNLLQSVVHTDSFRLIDETSKELKVGVTLDNEYNMLGTSQMYYFDSNNTQNYKIYVAMGQTLNVYDSLGNEINKNNGYYYLENNKRYFIVVSNYSGLDREYSITIDYPAVGEEIEVSSNGVYYLRYIPTESNVYYIENNNTYYNGTTKDIAFLNKDERYEIKVTNYSSSNIVITPNVFIPQESGTKYIYEDIQLSGDYIINSDNQCYVTINNKIQDIIRGEIIYLNATKIYSKSEITVKSANCSYIPYLNDEEIISNSINRMTLANDIIITIRRYQDGEYVSDYNGFIIQQELPNIMDASVYEVTITNIPNSPNFEFVLAPLNPIIAEISFDKLIDNSGISVSINIRFEENFKGTINGTIKDDDICFDVSNGYSNTVKIIYHEKIQFNKYNELSIYLYAKYNNNNQGEQYMFLSKEECMVTLDSSILIDCLLSPDFSYDYMDYLHDTVSEDNNYNTVVNKYKSYILSTINKEWSNGLCYNDIRHELQLLAILENYVLNMEISFDDGINYDSYIFGDAIIENIRLRKNLYYKVDCKFSIHGSYLYAVFKGSGYEIHSLNVEQNNLFIANYGEMINVRFVECSFRVVFSTYGYGIEEDVDFIYHVVGE